MKIQSTLSNKSYIQPHIIWDFHAVWKQVTHRGTRNNLLSSSNTAWSRIGDVQARYIHWIPLIYQLSSSGCTTLVCWLFMFLAAEVPLKNALKSSDQLRAKSHDPLELLLAGTLRLKAPFRVIWSKQNRTLENVVNWPGKWLLDLCVSSQHVVCSVNTVSHSHWGSCFGQKLALLRPTAIASFVGRKIPVCHHQVGKFQSTWHIWRSAFIRWENSSPPGTNCIALHCIVWGENSKPKTRGGALKNLSTITCILVGIDPAQSFHRFCDPRKMSTCAWQWVLHASTTHIRWTGGTWWLVE